MGMFDKMLKGTYQVKVKCVNCLRVGFADFIKGTSIGQAIESRACNNCGCIALELVNDNKVH